MRGIKREYVFAVRRPDGKFKGEERGVWTIDKNEAYLFATEDAAKTIADMASYVLSVDCTVVQLS